MGLQAILDAIRAYGEGQTLEIETGAYRKVNEILVEAHADAQRIREESCISASAPAYKERARLYHRARLESLRITGSAREALADTALDQTRERLKTIRKDEIYPSVLRRLTHEALIELEGSLEETGSLRLECDPRDEALLTGILQEMGLELPISATLVCWGGLVAKSEDNRVIVINTLEARLERAYPYLRHHLSAYFEEMQCSIMVMHACAP